ncbi:MULTISPECIES: hypothetical protein [unclassified Clostridium]|uniref:hypothetical protein n=1 Tax=unclassified Clostridium TaxID=2614128 RepID=UPI0009E5526B|nr:MULTISPECIES: hypothetical protein [unclassified Clostridium]
MKKLWKLEQLEELKSKYAKEVLQNIEEVITVLDENYGDSQSRHVDADLGGYVIIIDNEKEIKSIQSEILKDVIPEFTDEIKSDYTKYYTSLFLLSSDYAVTIYSNKEIHELLLGKVL